MARIRSVKPEYFDDPDIGQLSAEAALVFIGLWTQADRAGRLVDDLRRLKVRLRPYSTCDFDAVLAELVDAGFLIRYQSEAGARLLQVRTFSKHQKCHKDEKDSVLPGPTEKTGKKPGQQDYFPASSPVSGLLSLVSGSLESVDRSTPSDDGIDPVLVFPVIGRGPKSWALTGDYLIDLAKDYPTLDVLAECRAARAWCVANPNRQKTAKGMPAFLVNWLNRAVSARPVAPPKPPDRQAIGSWRDECERIHGGVQGDYCGNQTMHRARMQASEGAA